MNTILAKCIEELKKAEPRIDYVLGMLETLVEVESGKALEWSITKDGVYGKPIEKDRVLVPNVGFPSGTSIQLPQQNIPSNYEGAELDAMARSALEIINEMPK